MNKQRKRHISESKFIRIRNSDKSVCVVNNLVMTVYKHGQFLYWRRIGVPMKYYRKSIQEALK